MIATVKHLFEYPAVVLTALAAIVAPLTAPFRADARTINVRGVVLSEGSREPLEGVAIRSASTERLIGSTNIEGQFTVSVDENDDLIFSSVNAETLTEPVRGRLSLEVMMMPKPQQLEELLVVAKGMDKAFFIDEAELNVKGNYIHLKKYVKIPHKLFSSQVRMIIQPTIYDVTLRKLSYLKPVVFDGSRYAITQRRMHDFNDSIDPLVPFRQIKKTSRNTDDIVTISDSLYVENPGHDFICLVMSSLENYNRIIQADTFLIARGTVNPLRFLKYKLDGVRLTDKRYLPQPDVELRDTHGDMNLSFEIGKTRLNLGMGRNRAEIDALLSEFRAIDSNPDMMLKSFSIVGTASPEGSYEGNMKLARGRMNSAMDVILKSVPENMRRNADITTDANVASWQDVADLLRSDGRESEAQAVENVIAKYRGAAAMQNARMKRLPFYSSLLASDYLPRLRRVHYQIVTSQYRPLNDEEIKQLYATDYRKMSKYHFWRLYSNTPSPAARETVMRRALEVHPDFLVAASDLSAMLIDQDRADATILEPFFTDPSKWLKLPEEARYNMAASELRAERYSRADSLFFDLPDVPAYHKGKVYSGALNGRYQDVVREVSEDSPVNEVLLLLALKDNELAWERAQKLGDSAVEEYIKATAANRVDNYTLAMVHLENALRLDPSLRDVARVDGDLSDLIEDLDAGPSAAGSGDSTDL